MVPAGYMYKTIAAKPDWINALKVRDIFSVSNCISADFRDYINLWRHNGFWFFDSPSVIEKLAAEIGISLAGMKLLFYRLYPYQWDAIKGDWITYSPDPSFVTHVVEPAQSELIGYDVVTYHVQTSPECSPLSCNNLATNMPVNEHCLFDTFEVAKTAIESGRFEDGEPGPYRIIEVRSVTPKITGEAGP
jgi:hypothetical protein